jgi:hypothetical protein
LAAALVATALSGPAAAQGTAQQIVSLQGVDPATLAAGYRTSQVVGAAVLNENDQVIGRIDDLIVTPDDKVPFAVLSVGGFLGIDRKLVVVPFSLIVVRNDRMTLIGATKQSLEKLPEFHYQL